MATVDELLRCIDDSDADVDRVLELLGGLTSTRDRSLVPSLTAAFDRFLEAGHWYGRDVIAEALAEIEGVAALPTLLRASAVDMDDDQDSLQSTIIGLLGLDPARARELLDGLDGDADARVRDVPAWAREFVEDYPRRKG
jgi:hypothetical protein